MGREGGISTDTMTVELSRNSCSFWMCRTGEDLFPNKRFTSKLADTAQHQLARVSS